jgi:hypothetical protein
VVDGDTIIISTAKRAVRYIRDGLTESDGHCGAINLNQALVENEVGPGADIGPRSIRSHCAICFSQMEHSSTKTGQLGFEAVPTLQIRLAKAGWAGRAGKRWKSECEFPSRRLSQRLYWAVTNLVSHLPSSVPRDDNKNKNEEYTAWKRQPGG